MGMMCWEIVAFKSERLTVIGISGTPTLVDDLKI